ncbi:MAG: hypothetical protein ACI8PZ_001050 [Myxococcota bacterium]|jgi:hypothetical protein
MRQIWLAALMACVGNDTAGEQGPTWTEDVQPVVALHCGGCHVDGGSAPFAFTTFEETADLSAAMLSAVDGGRMPPWSPDPGCGEFIGAPTFTTADAELIRAWHDAGTPEGPDAEPVAAPVVDALAGADLSGQVPGYTPFEGDSDQYRCFVLDGVDFSSETWLTASQVLPGTPQVHHALVYALRPSQRELVAGLEAEDPEVGYTCFGAPIPLDDGGLDEGFPTQVGAWVPGAGPVLLADDMAVRISAGSFVVLQVHYNTAIGERVPDTTTWQATVRDTPPAELFITGPLPVEELDIPAGEPEATFSYSVPWHGPGTLRLRQFAGHMHLLGTRVTATVSSPDAETCLLDIPDWDFDWQQAYLVEDEVEVVPGSSITVSCTYDNSAANQPVIDGVQTEPVDVAWGDGTRDEMCLLYVGRVEPYTPEPAADALACGEAAACMDTCADDPVTCALGCPETEADCGLCLLDAASTCAPTCLFGLLGQEDCIESCFLSALMLGAHLGTCLQQECPTAWDALAACGGEACDDAFGACGI